MAIITDKERIDEALELLWVLREDQHPAISHFKTNSDDADTEAMIETLLHAGLASVNGTEIHLTEKGHKSARGLVRRQRLAERLFTDVFEMPDDTVVNDACKMEHILSEELTRAKPDADDATVAKSGYVRERYAIEMAEKAGFQFVGKSEINANPKDTKDYPDGVWTLPPTYRKGDVDRAKYQAIGESDRMTLKFIKPKGK